MLPNPSEQNIQSQAPSTIHVIPQHSNKNRTQPSVSESSSVNPNKHFPDSIKASIKKHSIRRKTSIKPRMPQSLQRKKTLQLVKCGICEEEYQKGKLLRLCECDHLFCESCLDSYIKYRIGVFERISCPEADCEHLINLKGDFYLNLDLSTRKKYHKIHLFYLTRMNPHLRLCPSENCEEGILELPEDCSLRKEVQCQSCKAKFCSNCFLPPHPGDCDNDNVNFYEDNLKFRQCSNCKMVVERSEGCVHMTCRCGYQFCYVCGVKWTESHMCFDFEHHQNECGELSECPIALKIPMKLVLLIMAAVLAVLQLTISILYVAFWFPLFIIFSVSCGTIMVIGWACEVHQLLGGLLVVLFPVAMLISFVVYGWEFLSQQVADIFRQSFICIFVMFYDILTF